jgi:Polyketide cyclase / dehydrase and lipid transport
VAQSLFVDESRVVPIPAEEAFHRTLPAPLPDLFKRWHGPFPPVKEVREQTGAWDAAGQTRTVRLAGGASMHEELIGVDPPRSFGYRLTKLSGPWRCWSTMSSANGSSLRRRAEPKSPGAGTFTPSHR